MPFGIGRGTTRVLKGCLERDARVRWTIAMVDEIAWDIGWGEADQSSSVSHGDEFEFIDFPNQPSASTCRQSRSRSCDHNSAFDQPSSRSCRSLSRTSITTSSSLSTRSSSRSVSRPPTTHLPLAAACDDVGHAVSSHAPLDLGGSALMSPTPSVERGRSLRKADPRLNDRFSPSLGASTPPSDFGREPSHGRGLFSGTDVLENTARWASALGLNTIAEVTTHLNGAWSPAVEKLRKIQNQNTHPSGESKGCKRAESTPPVSSAWPLRRSRAGVKEDLPLRPGEFPGVGGAFLREPSTTPIPIPRSGTRSRSVGHEPDSIARRRF